MTTSWNQTEQKQPELVGGAFERTVILLDVFVISIIIESNYPTQGGPNLLNCLFSTIDRV